MVIRDRPILTDIYASIDAFVPEEGSAYVFCSSIEERSIHGVFQRQPSDGIALVEVIEEHATDIVVTVHGIDRRVALRSRQQLSALWEAVGTPSVYLDITGLRHHVWAPLLRSALEACSRVVVVYVEPRRYRPSLAPTEGAIYDLSESISGVSPIPGFTSLDDNSDDVCFVPLLGFEGTRLAYLLEKVQPPGGKTVPIVGVPGFMPEYPFVTYLGNRLPLLEKQAWKEVRYAAANCPFSLFYALEDIAADYPSHRLKIAPIGTKPHAIGAILYKIVRPESVELVYDHPIRKAKRTEGTARLLAYNVSSFMA
jgi:hypothetical protein